jgi:hypothetical protein
MMLAAQVKDTSGFAIKPTAGAFADILEARHSHSKLQFALR